MFNVCFFPRMFGKICFEGFLDLGFSTYVLYILIQDHPSIFESCLELHHLHWLSPSHPVLMVGMYLKNPPCQREIVGKHLP